MSQPRKGACCSRGERRVSQPGAENREGANGGSSMSSKCLRAAQRARARHALLRSLQRARIIGHAEHGEHAQYAHKRLPHQT